MTSPPPICLQFVHCSLCLFILSPTALSRKRTFGQKQERTQSATDTCPVELSLPPLIGINEFFILASRPREKWMGLGIGMKKHSNIFPCLKLTSSVSRHQDTCSHFLFVTIILVFSSLEFQLPTIWFCLHNKSRHLQIFQNLYFWSRQHFFLPFSVDHGIYAGGTAGLFSGRNCRIKSLPYMSHTTLQRLRSTRHCW